MASRTARNGWKKGLATNSVAAAFGSLADVVVKPTDGVVIDLSEIEFVENQIILQFFGAGAENNAGQARVCGWRQTPGGLWVAESPFITVDITLGTGVGVAGEDVIATDRWADTIAANGTPAMPSDMYRIFSPADNTKGTLILDPHGATLVQVQFAKGNATNLNCLYSWI